MNTSDLYLPNVASELRGVAFSGLSPAARRAGHRTLDHLDHDDALLAGLHLACPLTVSGAIGDLHLPNRLRSGVRFGPARARSAAPRPALLFP